jgi:thiol-disulfide isomerase/thioredoxin
VFAKYGRTGSGPVGRVTPSAAPARADARRNRLRLVLAGALAVGALAFAASQIVGSLEEEEDFAEAPAGFWGPSETCHVEDVTDGQIQTVPVDSIGDLLEERRGCLVLLEVYASWCPNCRRVFPLVSEMAAYYYKYGVRVVALATDEDPNRLRSFLATQTVDFPVFWVPPYQPGELGAALSSVGASYDDAIPFFALIDPSGRPVPDVTARSNVLDVNDAIAAELGGRR